jgi:hypothetical protein
MQPTEAYCHGMSRCNSAFVQRYCAANAIGRACAGSLHSVNCKNWRVKGLLCLELSYFCLLQLFLGLSWGELMRHGRLCPVLNVLILVPIASQAVQDVGWILPPLHVLHQVPIAWHSCCDTLHSFYCIGVPLLNLISM